MSRYRFSLSIHSVTTLLVGTTFGLSCNIALAASNLDCEKLLNARDLSKAQSVCQQALMSQQQAASREQKKPLIEAYAKAHHNLGMLYTLLGKPIETERHFRNQIEILDKLYPQGSVTTAQAYNNLGTLRQRSSQYDQAIAYYRRAVSMLESSAPKDEAKLTNPLLNLATALTDNKSFAEAKTVMLRLLKIRTRLHGPNSEQVADIHNRLGVLYHRSGAIELAEEQLRKALSIREITLGANHQLLAESCTNLATVLMQQNRLNEALPLLRHAAAVTHTNTGSQSEKTLLAWNNLEQLYGRLIQSEMQTR